MISSCPLWACVDAIVHEGNSKPASSTPLLDMLERQPGITIETSRLFIRTPRKTDLPQLLPIFQDYRTVLYTWFRFEEGEVRWTEATLAQRYEWQAGEELQGNRHDFVMVAKDASHSVIGRCALYRPQTHGDWEFGITIHKDWWTRGYGEETTTAVLNYAFKDLAAKNVFLEVLPENEGMQQVCRKLNLRLAIPSKNAEPAGPFKLKYDYYAADQKEWLLRR